MHHSSAVLNNSDHKLQDVAAEKNNPEPSTVAETDKKIRETAEDRISGLSNEYGPPRTNFIGPAQSYGLPPSGSLGNYPPAPQFPLALPELHTPPLQAPPGRFYGPSRNPGPSFQLPKFPQFAPRPSKLPWKARPAHGPPIPISLEAYGPPNRPANPSFSPPGNDYGPPKAPKLPNDLYGEPLRPGPRPPGVAAPPTPPDIKYDGWHPIMGYAPQQSHPEDLGHASANIAVQPVVDPEPPRGIIDGSQPAYVPSNSYGEPITSPDDHNLKQSVHQGDDAESGLAPQPLPETEILHNIQGAAMSLPPHPTPSNNPQVELFEVQNLPHVDVNNDLSNLQLPPSSNFINHNENDGFQSSDDLSLQQLPTISNAAPSFAGPGPSQGLEDSYLAPPPSSYSASGPYPAAQRPSFGGSHKNEFNNFFQSHRYQYPRHYPRNPGPTRSRGPHGFPFPPLRNNLVPPRSWASVKFRQPHPPSFPKSSYGLPQEQQRQQLPALNCPSQPQPQSYHPNTIESTGFNQPIISIEDFPSVSQLELESNVPQLESIGPKDSYGNAIGYHQDQRSASSIQSSSTAVINGSSNESSGNELSLESLASVVTDQSYNQAETQHSANFNQLNSFHDENSEATQALAQTLSAEGASSDGFQIQGSKGTYTLQIQSADGAHGTENADGSIRHDQVLSNGLLQDILAAIEQPENSGHVKIQGEPQIQNLEEIYQQSQQDSTQLLNGGQHLTQIKSNDLTGIDQSAASPNEEVALYFNNGYDENGSRHQIRSTTKDESVATNNNDNKITNSQESL